ncbi:AaceriAEL165Cp [[Ashbya] aceris (nom. inval.)]|nr:AaceriAEL165Cp [[Ashbya] aceris (nom. inval.)]
MSSYTCNSCALAFESSEAQRMHMKSDWHRYNLKRRVAQLPPIDESTFNEKVAALATVEQQPPSSKEMRRRQREALLEKKKKLLEMARQSMLQNMGDELKVDIESLVAEKLGAAAVEPEPEAAFVEAPEMSAEEQHEQLMAEKIKNKVEIPLEACLFCPKRTHASFEENLEHMQKKHGFYIPEQKYLIDKHGLVKYLSEKIGLGNLCLCCSFQGRSLEAVRAHMLAKSHCRIPYESEDEKLEISEFYDFSSTYAELDAAANADDDQWEDVDSDADSDSGDEELPQELIYHDGVELHLPTGVKVGHRTLQRYYRQNLKPERELTEGQGTVIAAETRHFATILDRKQVATQKKVWQTQVKDKKRDSKRAAKFINNQPHYRDQLLQ